MWLTETAEAACGGDAFAGQFVDVFRYLNQLGTADVLQSRVYALTAFGAGVLGALLRSLVTGGCYKNAIRTCPRRSSD